MIKKGFTTITIAVLIFLHHLHAFSQDMKPETLLGLFGEVTIEFELRQPQELEIITRIMSIDRTEGLTVRANASASEFVQFLQLGYAYRVIVPGHLGSMPEMKDFEDIRQVNNWNFYPTYTAYESLMYQFQTDHPDKCTIINIATLPSGRKLLGARINANGQPKPQFLYSSTMHGDETTGYILCLRLIDSLLTGYGVSPRITRLVDSVEIWIFPLANPDGTYYGGNHTVALARRRNANNVDLNRNYPDPRVGPHPDGNAWQPETIAFMTLAQQQRFSIGSNIHGGAEVCNYPWDTWSRLTADNSWWVYVCREYADTAQYYSPAGYMTYLNNGITNGFAWYMITGGRQDYMNYFHHCREFTLEISNTKLPPASQLPLYWKYNRRSLLNFIEQSLYGVRGLVTDSISGQPVAAQVFISGHDIDQSHVYSFLPHGNYHRYLAAGTYNLTFSAPCYQSRTITGVVVNNRKSTWLNVQLVPLALPVETLIADTSIAGQVAISWMHPLSQDVMLAVSTSPIGWEPEAGLTYNPGETVNGALILYKGTAGSFIHQDVLPNTQYHYKAWGIHNSTCYSAASSVQVTTGTFYYLDLKVILEGAYYQNPPQLMHTLINGLLPLSQPFNVGLPYFGNMNPVWHYTGNESVAAMPSNVVDWVLIELRDAPSGPLATSSAVVARKAGLLRNDGFVTNVNGKKMIFTVPVQQGLWAVVYHRNHLAIMSGQALPYSEGTYSWDFTSSQANAYNGGIKPVGTSLYAMFSGDGDGNKQVQNQDKNAVWAVQAGMSGYLGADFDLNGQVQNQDKNNYWNVNSGTGSAIPN